MPRVRIDLKGIMTDLPPENIPQGACQEQVNLRYVDGTWRPIATKKIDWHFDTLSTNNIINYFKHIVSGYIITVVCEDVAYVGGMIKYKKYNTTSNLYEWINLIQINFSENLRFASFGNYLLMLDGDSGVTYYSKFESNNGDYSYTSPLEWNIPLPKISFGSDFELERSHYFTCVDNFQDNAKGVYNMIKNDAAERGMITSMVFIRYAIKLFDGSYINHSPIRYVTGVNSAAASSPKIQAYGKTPTDANFDSTDDVSYKYKMTVQHSKLTYRIDNVIGTETELNNDVITTLKQYKYFITSIDVFMSDQIEIFKTDGITMPLTAVAATEIGLNGLKYKELFNKVDNFYYVRSFTLDELVSSYQYYPLIVGDNILSPESYNRGRGTASTKGFTVSETGNITDDQYIYESSKVAPNTYNNSKSNFANVRTFKALPIDDSVHNITGNVVRVFNSRLVLADTTELLFKGYPTMLFVEPGTGGSASRILLRVSVFLNTNDGEKVVVSNYAYTYDNSSQNSFLLPVFLIYPDSRAYKIRIHRSNGGSYTYYKGYTLTKHPYLNLSYVAIVDTFQYSDYVNTTEANIGSTGILPTVIDKIKSSNQVVISRVNNPFVFHAENRNLVGISKITKILTNSTQMSEGQFGLHPLIVLTEGGIYAMEISLGAVFARNIIPISSDVCMGDAINFYSDTLKSDVIVYISRTGLKILHGKEITDFTQYVKNDMTGALDVIKDKGYTFIGNITVHTSLSLNEIGKLTQNSAPFTSGQYVVRSGISEYKVFDYSYYLFANFDNYTIPLEVEDGSSTNIIHKLPPREQGFINGTQSL